MAGFAIFILFCMLVLGQSKWAKDLLKRKDGK